MRQVLADRWQTRPLARPLMKNARKYKPTGYHRQNQREKWPIYSCEPCACRATGNRQEINSIPHAIQHKDRIPLVLFTVVQDKNRGNLRKFAVNARARDCDPRMIAREKGIGYGSQIRQKAVGKQYSSTTANSTIHDGKNTQLAINRFFFPE